MLGIDRDCTDGCRRERIEHLQVADKISGESSLWVVAIPRSSGGVRYGSLIMTVVGLVVVGWCALGVATIAAINLLRWFVWSASQPSNDRPVSGSHPAASASVRELPKPIAASAYAANSRQQAS